MFDRFAPKSLAHRLIALMSLLWLAACDPTLTGLPGASAPTVDPNAPVQVALLVPGNTGSSSDAFIAASLENAARLAIADLSNVQINLRVYNTAANAAGATTAANAAMADGAKIILGPLYAEAANAAGVAAAAGGINVLAFSNNPTIAGGNVFILGPTFENSANRLVAYGSSQGLSRYMVVHAEDLGGQLGRQAIEAAVRANGASLVGVQSYPFSAEAVVNAAPIVASTARAANAEVIFMTAGPEAELSILATVLPEAGLSTSSTQYMGLTQWSASPQSLSLPGLQGGVFAVPDQATSQQFAARYEARYGAAPHPRAGLAYDGIAAIGALVASGNRNALSASALTTGAGFQGTDGIFRLRANGTNQRGLAVARVENGKVVIVSPAPRSFGGAGF